MTPRARLRLTAVIGLALLLAVAWQQGVFAAFERPRQLADALVAQGAAGYVAFIAAYALLQPFGVPGTVFIVAAPLIWPWPIAFALSMVGTMLASVLGFSFARFIAREWVEARIPPALRRFDAALATRAFETTFLLRLVFWMPQPLHYLLGVSRVPFWTHVLASFFGYIPPLLLVSVLGDGLFDDAGALQTDGLPALAALSAASIALAFVLGQRVRRESSATPAREGDR